MQLGINACYIASDHEVDRIKFMEEWIGCANVNRVHGVVLAEFPDCYDQSKRLARFGYDLTLTEIGCFLAHRQTWLMCVELGEPLLVLEGDCYPQASCDLFELMTGIVQNSDKFDVLRLHGIFEHNEFLKRKILDVCPDYSMCQCLGDPMGAASYVVTPCSAETLLGKSSIFFQPVDVFIGATWIHHLRVRSVKPFPFKTFDFASTIGERRRPNQTNFERLKIESHRALDDARRILRMPKDFFR